MTVTTTATPTTATTTETKKKNGFQTNFLTMHEEQFRVSKTTHDNNKGKAAKHPPPPLMSCAEIAHYTYSQVTEAISLLRHLASCSNTKWPIVVRYVLPFESSLYLDNDNLLISICFCSVGED